MRERPLPIACTPNRICPCFTRPRDHVSHRVFASSIGAAHTSVPYGQSPHEPPPRPAGKFQSIAIPNQYPVCIFEHALPVACLHRPHFSQHLQAAARSESAIISDFMHLSLIRRELPRWGADTKQFAGMYRRGMALTLNLENENCLQGAIRALVEQQAMLNRAARGA
jgi:hypothetical protein